MTTKILCGLAAAAVLAAADGSYVGKWKMNVAKSDFGDTTITFGQAPSGGMQMTVDGQTYSFKTDGKEYDGVFGSKMSWKATGGGAWEVTNQDGRQSAQHGHLQGIRGWQEPEPGVQGDLAGGCAV
jgi:hypothetical protein